jgi:hypothetical protein
LHSSPDGPASAGRKEKRSARKTTTTKSGKVNKEREKMGEEKGKREATVHYLQSTAIVKDGRSREGTWVVYGGKSVRE